MCFSTTPYAEPIELKKVRTFLDNMIYLDPGCSVISNFVKLGSNSKPLFIAVHRLSTEVPLVIGKILVRYQITIPAENLWLLVPFVKRLLSHLYARPCRHSRS
jgi:hypothetical protein